MASIYTKLNLLTQANHMFPRGFFFFFNVIGRHLWENSYGFYFVVLYVVYFNSLLDHSSAF